MKAPANTGSTSGADTGAPVGSGVGMGIIGIAADFDVVENGKRVLRQDGERAIKRDEVGCDGLAVDPHEADRKARRDFARNAGLKEPDNALLLFAGANQEDLGCLGALFANLDLDLV